LVLGVVIAALLIIWSRQEPPVPTTVATPIETERPAEPTLAKASLAQLPEGGLEEPQTVASVANTDEDLATSSALYGTVTDAEGKPVDGYMWLSDGTVQLGMCSLRRGATAFVFAGLRPGNYQLTSRFTDQLPLRREVEVSTTNTRLDLVLDASWQLTVHAVTLDGEPLTKAAGKGIKSLRMSRKVCALALRKPLVGDLPPSSRGVTGAGLGVFRGTDPFREKVMAKTAVGVLTLPPGQPLHVALMMGDVLLAQELVAADTKEVTFSMATRDLLAKTATVRMRFVDENGNAVAGAQVNVGGSFDPKSKTDENGRIEFSNVLPGRPGFRASLNGLFTPSYEVSVAAAADVDLGDLVMRASVGFEVNVEDFDDSGGIYFYRMDAALLPGLRINDHYIGASNGKQKRVELFPGRYTVFARSDKGVAVRTIDTTAVAGQVLQFDLQRGADLRFVGSLYLPVQVEIMNGIGQLVSRRELSGSLGYSRALPVGTYRVKISHADGRITNKVVQLSASGAELRLP
jgi:hypothetical protein